MKKAWLRIAAVTTVLLVSITSLGGCSNGKNEKVINSNESEHIKMFVNLNPATPRELDKAFVEDVEKATGVKLDFEIPPSTNYKERLQLMLVSGTLPDVVLFDEIKGTSMQNALDSDLIIPINDYLKKAPNIMNHTYDISWDTLKLKMDDKIYGIPRTSISRAPGFLVRKDWLDAVGLTLSAGNVISVEEFTEILKRFTKSDPDKNGKDDTYGFAACTDADKNLELVLENPFDLLGWQKSNPDGGIYMNPEFSKSTDNYTRAMAYTAELKKLGYLDPDAFINSGKVATDRFKRGICGVRMDPPTNLLDYEADMKKTNPSVELTYVTVKNEKGEYKGTGFGTAIWGVWAITKSCEKPENAIKVFDYMLSDTGWNKIINGIEGSDYKIENGKKVYGEDDPSWSRMFVRRKADYNFFISPKYTGDKRERVKPYIESVVNAFVPSEDRGFIPSVAKTPKYIEYQKTMAQIYTRILVGELPVSEYKKTLDGWYATGGEQYIKEMNEYITKIKQMNSN